MSKKKQDTDVKDVSAQEQAVAAEADQPRLDPETGEARPQVSEASAELTAERARRSRKAVNGAQTTENLLRQSGGTPVHR